MHALLHDITAAVVVVRIVIGVVRIVPIAIVVGASDKEVPAVAEAVVESTASHATEIAASETVALDGTNIDIASGRPAREAIAEVSAADTSRGEATAAKSAATESASAATATTETTAAVAATTSTAASATGQSHVRRQRSN